MTSDTPPYAPDRIRRLQAIGDLLRGATDPVSAGTGGDPAGVVEVTVDGRGGVSRVDIAPEWLSALGPSALGEAIMSAYRSASTEVAGAMIRRFRAAIDRGGMDGPATRPPGDTVVGAPDDGHDRHDGDDGGVEGALERLARAERRLAEIDRRTQVSGRAGLLRLDLNRGQITGMTAIDRRRVARARPEQLAAEALWLLARATAAGGDLSGNGKG